MSEFNKQLIKEIYQNFFGQIGGDELSKIIFSNRLLYSLTVSAL
jgi:hypothetical protein